MLAKIKTTLLFSLLLVASVLIPLSSTQAQEGTGCCAAVPNNPLVDPFAEMTDQYHCNIYTQLGNTVKFYTDREVSSDGKTCVVKTLSNVQEGCSWETPKGGICVKDPDVQVYVNDEYCPGDRPAGKECCCSKAAMDKINEPYTKGNVNKEPPKPREIIAPILSVSIPGLTKFTTVTCDDKNPNCSIPWIAEYIGAIFKYSMLAVAILAVIVMMIGGVIWITAGSNSGRISQAKDFIKNGLLGTTLALCSYMALFLINPDLTILPPINVGYIDKIDIPEELPPQDLTSQYTSGPKGIVGFSSGQFKVPILYQNSYSGEGLGLGKCGCGPTSLTMVLNYYGINQTVEQTAAKVKSAGNWEGGNDTDCGGWRGGMDGFKKQFTNAGLQSKTGTSFEDAINLLQYGPVIMSIKNTGGCAFTGHAHYVVLTGYNNGTLVINDPNKKNFGTTDNITLTKAKTGCSINAGVIVGYK